MLINEDEGVYACGELQVRCSWGSLGAACAFVRRVTHCAALSISRGLLQTACQVCRMPRGPFMVLVCLL